MISSHYNSRARHDHHLLRPPQTRARADPPARLPSWAIWNCSRRPIRNNQPYVDRATRLTAARAHYADLWRSPVANVLYLMLPGPAAIRTSLVWVTSGPNKPPRLWTRKTRFYGTSIPQSHSGPILTFWNRTGWLTQGLYWAQSSSLHTILYWTAHRSISHQSGVQNNSPSLAPGGIMPLPSLRRNSTSAFTWLFSCQPTYHLNQTRRITQHNLTSRLTACDPPLGPCCS